MSILEEAYCKWFQKIRLKSRLHSCAVAQKIHVYAMGWFKLAVNNTSEKIVEYVVLEQLVTILLPRS